MEGVVDDLMRDTLTRLPGIDWCVSEFIRITQTILPPRQFYRMLPELRSGAMTPSGVPVRAQLLGSDSYLLAENAKRLAELGAPVIDLNFGCPAPTVNRHRGGAILLQEPALLYEIVSAVRAAVPDEIPVTAKMRLGYEDKTLAIDCAQALVAGGAASLVVHARTKIEGYRPPAHWQWIAKVAESVPVPVMANGEIWSVADYQRCREESGQASVMLGRGLLARPSLAAEIQAYCRGEAMPESGWRHTLPILEDFFHRAAMRGAGFALSRLKQWLAMLGRDNPEAKAFCLIVRQLKDPALVMPCFEEEKQKWQL
ncbi:tRNA dihydrouridine synthase [Aquaspirillum serpens]|uniref:tRNA dihydrouridine synthase n=1 Tax=Aquaspirillum serpens TaxID=190 RepID=UPI0024807DDD|nr:tRNA-dihydrouridine synthase family protein [Aquaspirillum serpens]